MLLQDPVGAAFGYTKQIYAAPGRYICVAAGGLRNLPSRLHPELIIPCEIGHRTAKAFILLLQSLKFCELIRPHTTVQFAQTIIRLFRNLKLANSDNSRLALSYQNIYFAWLRKCLFRFVSFPYYLRSSGSYHKRWTNSVGNIAIA